MGKKIKGSPGRKLKPLPALTEVQLDELEQAARSSAKPCVRRRAAIVCDLYAGLSIREVARKNEKCCQTVRKWRERARRFGVDALANAPRFQPPCISGLPAVRVSQAESRPASVKAPACGIQLGASAERPSPGQSWFERYARVRELLAAVATRSSSQIDWLRSTTYLLAACERTGLNPCDLDRKFGPRIGRLGFFRALARTGSPIRRGTTKERFEGELDPIRRLDEEPDLRGTLAAYDSLFWLVAKRCSGLDLRGCKELLELAFEMGDFWRPNGFIVRHKPRELEEHLASIGAPTGDLWAGDLDHLRHCSDRPLDTLALLILLEREAVLTLQLEIAKARRRTIRDFCRDMSACVSLQPVHRKLVDIVYDAIPAPDRPNQGDDVPWLVSRRPAFRRSSETDEWAARVTKEGATYDDAILRSIEMRQASRQVSNFLGPPLSTNASGICL